MVGGAPPLHPADPALPAYPIAAASEASEHLEDWFSLAVGVVAHTNGHWVKVAGEWGQAVGLWV